MVVQILSHIYVDHKIEAHIVGQPEALDIFNANE